MKQCTVLIGLATATDGKLYTKDSSVAAALLAVTVVNLILRMQIK